MLRKTRKLNLPRGFQLALNREQAEPILEKYLRLRYELLPYIYSLGYGTYQTGAPFMRALFMDFPDDPNAADIPDEYMLAQPFS